MITLPHNSNKVQPDKKQDTIHNGYSSYSTTRNSSFQANLLNIPAELRELNQWVVWRYELQPNGKWCKVPYRPLAPKRRADVTNSRHWGTFEQALLVMVRHSFDGIGFVFTEDDPFVGIDFDHCASDGVINPAVLTWLTSFTSYAEFSPSGTGIHVIVRATLRYGRKVDAYEIYGQDRFFAMTGQRVPGTPYAIRDAQQAVDSFVAHLDILKPQTPHSDLAAAPQSDNLASLQPLDTDDYALLRRMFAARNGQRLWAIWHGQDGENPSIGDMVLCSSLAFWTGRDPERMERLFRQSDRVRDKIDRAARSADANYLAGTIRIAIANCTKVYQGGHHV